MRTARYAAPAAALLILAACGRGDDKPAGDFDDALAALHLTEATADNLTWESYQRDGNRAVFKNLTVTPGEDDANDGEASESTIAALTVENPRMDGGEPVFDSWDMQDFSASGEDARLSIAHINLTDANPEMVRLILDAADDEDDDVDSETADDMPFSALAFGAFKMEDLRLNFDDEDGTGEMTLDSIDMSDLEDGRMASASVNDFVFSGSFAEEETGEMTPVSFSIAEISMNDIYARSMDMFSLNSDDEEGFSRLMKQMQEEQRKGEFDVNGVLKDMEADIAGLKFALPEMSYSTQTEGDRMITVSDIPDMTLGYDESGRLGAQAAKFAGMFGYQALRFSMHNEQVWDRKTDRLTVKDSWMEMEDGFRSETTLDVDGYGAYSEAVSEKAMQSGDEAASGFKLASLPLDKIKLREFRFQLEDKGLADNIFNGVGQMQGQDPEAMRAQAIGMVALLSAFAPPNTPRAQLTELSTALTQFLQTPGTLTISMDPDAPLPLDEVINEDGSYNVAPLNFSAETEAP